MHQATPIEATTVGPFQLNIFFDSVNPHGSRCPEEMLFYSSNGSEELWLILQEWQNMYVDKVRE